MLRRLAALFCMTTAFAGGYGLGPAPSDSDVTGSVQIAIAEPPPQVSVHYKFTPSVVVKVRPPVTLPPTATADAPQKPAIVPNEREKVAEPVRPFRPELPPAMPLTRSRTQLVSFASAPFPYDGVVPRTQSPFLNFKDSGRVGHKTFSGRIYWADSTYSDSRVLLHVPKGFDTHRPGVMVLFFHGHGATLERDVLARQRVPEQITESGLNAVLVAPQFAVDARDSSAGKLWTPQGLRKFLEETADQLTQIHGDPSARRMFASMPVVIVGYSGGYVPTAAALSSGVATNRIRGAVLLDGLYGEIEKFARWIEQTKNGFFLSAYTNSTRRGNGELMRILSERNVKYATALNGRVRPGSVTFVEAEFGHRDYVTRAWAENPISDLLRRMTGIAPRARIDLSASLDLRLAR
ncbi:MAG: alpha/beta hydrolase [Pseudomonadota bacterium]|nr:alpha/beta hydrolase [Pseudomonadota bacterium]